MKTTILALRKPAFTNESIFAGIDLKDIDVSSQYSNSFKRLSLYSNSSYNIGNCTIRNGEQRSNTGAVIFNY